MIRKSFLINNCFELITNRKQCSENRRGPLVSRAERFLVLRCPRPRPRHLAPLRSTLLRSVAKCAPRRAIPLHPQPLRI